MTAFFISDSTGTPSPSFDHAPQRTIDFAHAQTMSLDRARECPP